MLRQLPADTASAGGGRVPGLAVQPPHPGVGRDAFGGAICGGINRGATPATAVAPYAPRLAESVELLLHHLCARLFLQALHVLLECEFADLLLSAQGVVLPCNGVQLQVLLHTLELLLQRVLVQLLLRLVEPLRACMSCGTRTGCLVPTLIELPLRVMECQGAIKTLQLCALGECVDVCLLGRARTLLSPLVGRCPAGGRSEQHCGQEQTCSHRPEEVHRRPSLSC